MNNKPRLHFVQRKPQATAFVDCMHLHRRQKKVGLTIALLTISISFTISHGFIAVMSQNPNTDTTIGQSCCLRNIHALTCSFAGYTSSMSSFNSTHSMLYATVLHVQTSEFGRYRLASSGGCRPRRGCPAPLSCCTPQSVGSRQLDRSVCYPSDWLFP